MTIDTPHFTNRELQVLMFVKQGLTNKQIALLLGVKPVTVEFHLSNLYKKLNVSTRAEAVLQAEKIGI